MEVKLIKKGMAAMFGLTVPFMVSAAVSCQQTAAQLNAEGVKLVAAGQIEEALHKFEAAIDVDPTCMEATHNLGKFLILGKAYEGARSVLEHGLEMKADDAGCRVQLVQLYALTDKSEDFARMLDSLTALGDGTVSRDVTLLLLRQGSTAYADKAADKAIKTNENDPVCWFNKGLVQDALGQAGNAEGAYRRAVALKADFASAWINLGNVLDSRQDSDGAIGAYEKAWQAESGNTIAQYNLGRMLTLTGKDVDRGFHLLREASGGTGPAAKQAHALLDRLFALVRKGGAK